MIIKDGKLYSGDEQNLGNEISMDGLTAVDVVAKLAEDGSSTASFIKSMMDNEKAAAEAAANDGNGEGAGEAGGEGDADNGAGAGEGEGAGAEGDAANEGGDLTKSDKGNELGQGVEGQDQGLSEEKIAEIVNSAVQKALESNQKAIDALNTDKQELLNRITKLENSPDDSNSPRLNNGGNDRFAAADSATEKLLRAYESATPEVKNETASDLTKLLLVNQIKKAQ